MTRREQLAAIRLTTVTGRQARPVQGGFKASTKARAAGEISDVLVALRARAQEFDLKFLSYLLEMAFIEAFEQSQKEDAAS